MSHKRKDGPSGNASGSKKPFPPEAYACADDVDPKVVTKLRAEVGVDVSDGEWDMIDGFGKVINA